MVRKIVFSGGPCSGKSAVIEDLKKRGYSVSGEIARQVHEERKGYVFNQREVLLRQLIIFQRQLVVERELDEFSEENVVFFDRSLIDCIVYSNFLFGYLVEDFSFFKLPNRYDKVFFFHRLPYIDDGVRVEQDEESARKVHDYLKISYQKYGYDVTDVSVKSIEERADFVLDFLNGEYKK